MTKTLGIRLEFLAFFLVVLVAGVSGASPKNGTELKVIFTLHPEKVEQKMQYIFHKPLSGEPLEYAVSGDVTDAAVFINGESAKFNVSTGESSVFHISPDEPVYNLTLFFSSTKMIYKNNDVRHFFTEMHLDNATISQASAQAFLPAGYGLPDDSFNPDEGIISSNGQNIVVTWDSLDLSKEIFFRSNSLISLSSRLHGIM